MGSGLQAQSGPLSSTVCQGALYGNLISALLRVGCFDNMHSILVFVRIPFYNLPKHFSQILPMWSFTFVFSIAAERLKRWMRLRLPSFCSHGRMVFWKIMARLSVSGLDIFLYCFCVASNISTLLTSGIRRRSSDLSRWQSLLYVFFGIFHCRHFFYCFGSTQFLCAIVF